MKRQVLWFLVLCFAILLAGCANKHDQTATAEAAQTTEKTTTEQTTSPFLVGFGRSVITPDAEGIHMAGSLNPKNKISTGIYDDLYATCIAFTDAEDQTILLFHMDLQRADSYAVSARDQLAETWGIPVDNIIISATHTHSGPNSNYFENENYPRLIDYAQNVLMPGIMSAAEAAMTDRKPARMYGASINPEGLNFVRHYLLSDGSVAGDNFGSFKDKSIVAHVSEADNQMQLLCFKREGGKDVVMMNWQAHAHRSGIKHTNFTADIVGAARSYMEAELDCHFAYFAGASGNVNSSSRITHENITADYIEHGQELAKYGIMALENMTELELGRVQAISEVGRADMIPMKIFAFSIGDVGFAVAPYEMFTENGQFIKRNSPFETTFVVTCANGKSGYFPSKSTYAYENYEYESNHIPEGNAEEMADLYVQLLTNLHSTRTLEEQATYTPAATEATDLYWNLDRGTARTTDGIRLLHQGQVVTVHADKALLARMDSMDLFGLTLDGDTVQAVHPLIDMPYKRLSINWYVVSMKDGTLTLNADEAGLGKTLTVSIPEQTPIWSVTKAAPMTRELQPSDIVTVVTDSSGTPTELFAEEVAIDVSALETTTRYCTHCKLETSFYVWNLDGLLPNAEGHYVLDSDIDVTAATTLRTGNICLDLNGKTITQKTFGTRMFIVEGTVSFALMDTAGTGRMVAATSDTSGASSGMLVFVNNPSAKFYLYGGTLDASETTCEFSCCVYMKKGYMEMYGGTMLGGTTYGSGSPCIAVGELSEFVMYDGTMVGGLVQDSDFISGDDTLQKGGAIMRVTGTATIYNGTFIGGKSELNGGALYVKPKATLYLLGGTVSGGSCSGSGAGLYLEGLSTLVLGSDVVITGNTGTNLFFSPSAMISVHEEGLSGTRIGVTAQEEGVFLKGSFTAADAAHFVSDNPGMKIVVTEEGLALEKA